MLRRDFVTALGALTGLALVRPEHLLISLEPATGVDLATGSDRIAIGLWLDGKHMTPDVLNMTVTHLVDQTVDDLGFVTFHPRPFRPYSEIMIRGIASERQVEMFQDPGMFQDLVHQMKLCVENVRGKDNAVADLFIEAPVIVREIAYTTPVDDAMTIDCSFRTQEPPKFIIVERNRK